MSARIPASFADVAIVAHAYLWALLLGLATAWITSRNEFLHPAWSLLAATSAATAVIFAASTALRNASMYDAYWSLMPLVTAAALGGGLAFGILQSDPVRAALVVALVTIYGLRLTWNWLRGWPGLHHQDWRYQQLEAQTGAFWPAVNLLGVHYMPTLMTWLGCLPLLVTLGAAGESPRGLHALDLLAFLVTAAGITLEAVADEQLRAFRASRANAGELLRTGLWARCRHPNYLGEILFWWGLALFGIATVPQAWWVLLGAASIHALFAFVTIRLIEDRLTENKPGYARYCEEVPRLLPRWVAMSRTS